jgi:integrase
MVSASMKSLRGGRQLRSPLSAVAHYRFATSNTDTSSPYLRKAGLENMRTHDLRHSCATLLLAADKNPKVVSERLGHASIVLTLDTYSHSLPTMQQAASEKLEKMPKRN